MLFKCGLLQKGSHNLLPYVSAKLYNARGNDEIAKGFHAFWVAQEHLLSTHECKPYFIGVWDTVASLGHFYAKRFFDPNLHGEIMFGYHAMSIDERRKKFPVTLWDETKKRSQQTIEQVWFAGVHSDVGGWYPQRGLSDSALKWMLLKAKAADLRLRDGWDSKEKINPDPSDWASQHESRTGFYRLWRRVERRLPEKALIHQSVFDRRNAGIGYSPSNLPKVCSVVQWDGEVSASTESTAV